MTLDTLRADHVGAYNGRDAHTPHLDTVAAQGVRFAAAISPAPLTLPAHASLLTGLEPPEHGVRHNGLHRLGGGIPTLAEGMRAAGLATAAFVGSLVLDRRYGLDRGFDVYDDAMGGRVSASVGYAERPADQVVEAALAWLEHAPARFFLWVHFYDPHARYAPPAGFASAFASRPYAGEIAFADSQLGRLFDEVRRRWPAGGTVFVVTSDHGESLGEHGEATHSYTLYEATQHIPLLMSGPGLPEGRVVTAPVGLIDVAPTLLALVGAETLGDIAGRDLRPLIDGGEDPARALYVETLATHLDYGWSALVGLRTSRFKYIRAPRPELYDLQADPAERHDVAALQPRTVQRLDALLAARLAAAEPRAEGRLAVGLGAVERAQLQSLGYVVPAPGREPLAVDPGVAGPDPKDAIGLLRLLDEVERDVEAGKLERAYARLAGVAGGGVAVAARRAAIAVATGDYAAAERDARAVLASQPDRPDVLIILGRTLAAQARLEEARTAFAAAAHLDSRSATAEIFLGRIHQNLNDAGAAVAAYTRAAAADPAANEARWRLAVLHLEGHDLMAADAVLAELARLNPLDPAASVALALAEARAGRLAAATARLEAAAAAQPADPRFDRARASIRAGQIGAEQIGAEQIGAEQIEPGPVALP